jgi:hypothetical protein
MSANTQASGTTTGAWPAAIVASVIISVIGAVAVTSIYQYTVDDALKIWSGLSGLIGLVTGVIATYFFASSSIQTANEQTRRANERADEAQNTLARERRLGPDVRTAFVAARDILPADQWDRLRTAPAVKAVLPPDMAG